MKVTSSSGVSKPYITMLLTYCYLKEEKEKVYIFYVNNFCYFEISASLF